MSQQSDLFGEAPAADERPPEIRLSQYWAVLVKHRRLIFLCVAVGLALAVLVSVLSKPSYLATAVLAAEKERGSPLDANWKPQVYGGYDPEFLPTQSRLMKSREVAERVVRKLNLLENRELNPRKSGLFRLGTKREPALSPQKTMNRLVQEIRQNTTIEPVRNTNLLQLSYVGPSPKLTADIANAVAEAYIDWNREAKFRIVGQASEFLNAQIKELKKQLDAKERERLAYGRQKDIISIDPKTSVTLQNLESLNRDYAAAVADRVAKEARYYEVRTAPSDAAADTLSGGLVWQLRNEQARLERDYAEKLNLFKPEWPAMQELKAQIDKGRQHLESAIRETAAKARDAAKEAAKSEYQTALRREESLREVLRSQKSDVMTSSSNAIQYYNLQDEVETKRVLLDTVLRRQAETEMISRLSGSNVLIVDRALPPSGRHTPSYRNNLLLALFGGGLLGVGLAFFLSYTDRSLRTSEQVEEYLQLPALGIIPLVGAAAGKGYGYVYGSKPRGKKKREGSEEERSIELLPHQHPRARVAERYRAFRTALLLSRAGGVKSIVITSSFSQEGKTVTAVNLAAVLGQLGKRVLLVDADLHRARLHEIFRVSNRIGLVSILAENLEPARAIVKTEVPGVFVVPSGPSSPNPSGLLSSEAMSKFLGLAQMNFDYVLLDAPPVVPVADALVLGHQTDGVVLCVKGGETPREHVARGRDKLLRSNVRILGVLINNLVEDPDEYGQRGGRDSYYDEKSGYGDEQRAASAARTL